MTEGHWLGNMTRVSQKEISTKGKRGVLGEKEKGLPDSIRSLFWDVYFDRFDIGANSFFIISRILEHGDEPSARFLLQTYSEDEIIHVVKTSRSLSKRSRNFWMIYFGVEDLDDLGQILG